MRLNPIEFYEGYVISTTFAFTSQVDRSFLYPSSNRDFYLAIHLVTVAANDQGKKLCRALSPSTDLSSSVIQPIIPENTKIITYIPHNFALWQNFPSIYRLVGARLKNLSLDESTRAEYLSLTGRVRGPALFFATREISRPSFRLPSVITSFAITRNTIISRPIFGNFRGISGAACNVCSCV